MILVPIAVILLCLCATQAWRRKWKNAALYLLATLVVSLVYALWAQSHVTEYQRTRIEALNAKVNDLQRQLTESAPRY